MSNRLSALQQDFLNAFFQIELGDDLIPPGGVSAEELRQYLADLMARLTRLAFPLQA